MKPPALGSQHIIYWLVSHIFDRSRLKKNTDLSQRIHHSTNKKTNNEITENGADGATVGDGRSRPKEKTGTDGATRTISYIGATCVAILTQQWQS